MPSKTKAKATPKAAAKTPPKSKVAAAAKVLPKAPPPKGPVKVPPKPVTGQKDEAPEKEVAEATPDTPLPLLDLSDAEVKKMIKLAKKRGYVTHEQINAVLPSEEVTSDQIEDVFAMLNEMGINVVESEEPDAEEAESREEEESDDGDGDLVEVSQKTPAKSEKAEPGERTDDPVRMYLREMGSVELLSREGEIAIAKRIEAGREAMIAGLCESPLTFQAIIIWRDELNEGKITRSAAADGGARDCACGCNAIRCQGR
jgi:RNA polymerase primary sigma factor